MADLTKMYFGDPHPRYEVLTADVEAYVLEQNCQALILNPGMEEKDLFWSYTDRDRSKIKVIPGEGGSGHALRVYDRDNSWRGLKQLLDARCFVAGEVYAITGNFRLTDSSLNGVACDPNYQWNNNEGTQCPSVVVHGSDCEGGNVYWQFWNGKSVRTFFDVSSLLFLLAFHGTHYIISPISRTKHGIRKDGIATKPASKLMISLLRAAKLKFTFIRSTKIGIWKSIMFRYLNGRRNRRPSLPQNLQLSLSPMTAHSVPLKNQPQCLPSLLL